MRTREKLLAALRNPWALRVLVWAWRVSLAVPALRALWKAGAHLVAGNYGYAFLWTMGAVLVGAIGLVIGMTVLQDEQQLVDRRLYLIDCATGNVTKMRRR